MQRQKNTKPGGKITKSPSPAAPKSTSGRTREISLAYREPNEAAAFDAKKESRGDDAPVAAADEPESMGERPFSTGRKIKNHLPQDDQTTARMVQKGVNEAEQDEMVVASKTRTKSEG